jgi:hypothetical protein
MRWIFVMGVALALSLAACGSSEDTASQIAAQKQADIYAIDQIEVKWHKATSMKDVDLIMSLFAPDATATFGTTNLAGTGEIRDEPEHGPAHSPVLLRGRRSRVRR